MPRGFLLTQNCFCSVQKNHSEVQTERTWWGGCPGWCSRSWGSRVEAAPLCMSRCTTCSRDTEFSVHDLINQKCWLTTSFSSDWRREITHQFSTGQTWWFITAMAYLWAGTHHLQRGITRVSDIFYFWTTVLKNKGVRSAHKLMKWTSWSFFCVWSELFSLLCSWPGNKLLVCLLFCLIAFKHNQRNNQTFKLHIDFVTNSEYVVRIYIKKKIADFVSQMKKVSREMFQHIEFSSLSCHKLKCVSLHQTWKK